MAEWQIEAILKPEIERQNARMSQSVLEANEVKRVVNELHAGILQIQNDLASQLATSQTELADQVKPTEESNDLALERLTNELMPRSRTSRKPL